MTMTYLHDVLDKVAEQEAYKAWFKAFAKEVVKLTAMHPHDFPDWDFWSAFDDGVEPREAAEDFADEMTSGAW